MTDIRTFFAAFLLAATLIQPGFPADLTVTTHSASAAGFMVNSHLIAGERDAILVDAQFIRSEATKAIQMVKESGKNLKYILVTHGHPDHFFWLEDFRNAFPDARIVAAGDVISDIESYGPKAIAMWKPVFKDEIPDSFVTPKPVNSTSLFVDGQEIQLLPLKDGESAHATAVWIPGSRALIAGDLAYNNVHLWLRENRPETWLAILDRLEKLKPATVYPGHGPVGGPEVLAADREYIQTFIAATAAPVTREEAMAKLKAAYPHYALPMIIEYSVGGRIK
ncbi:MAG TPA: MBL fold metallo-hydrolase [Burkholderiales bacterium]|nr:MBL fold metallo-hydrolase [Burkholderiales bacterium]